MRRFSCKHTYHFTYSDSLSSIFFHLIMWSIFKSSRRISSIYSFWLQAVIRSHCLPGFTLSKLFFFLSNGFLLVNIWPVITLFKDAVIEIKMKPVLWNYPPLSLSVALSCHLLLIYGHIADPREILSQNWSIRRRCQVASHSWPGDIFSTSLGLHRAGEREIMTWLGAIGPQCLGDQFSFLQDENNWISSHVPTFSAIDPSYALPNNIAVITLQVMGKFLN